MNVKKKEELRENEENSTQEQTKRAIFDYSVNDSESSHNYLRDCDIDVLLNEANSLAHIAH